MVIRITHIIVIGFFSSEQMMSTLLFDFVLSMAIVSPIGGVYQFKIEHGLFTKIVHMNSICTVLGETDANPIALIFKRYLAGTDYIIGTVNDTRSSQPIYSIFNGCMSESCSMDVDEDLCYVISTMAWYHDDDMNTDDHATSNSTTRLELELCQPTFLSARKMPSADLDVVTTTTTALSSRSEMVVTTHLPYTITNLTINPLEYILLFNSSPIARVRSPAVNKSSFAHLQRNSFYRLDIAENPPNDLTFLVSLSMVIDELAKILTLEVN